jgi:GH18 family chitinase
MSIVILLSTTLVQAQTKVVGYVPNWINMTTFANTFDFSKVTHINVAFQNPVASGSLTKGGTAGLSALVNKAHGSNVKVLISLAGGTDSENAAQRQIWFNLIDTKAHADSFAVKVAAFVKQWNLDGVDVDLEGPAINAYYTNLISALSQVLTPQGKLLTSALKHDYGGNNVPNAALPYFDFINVMAYDQTGSWSTTPGQHSSMSYAQYSLNYWVGRGVPKSKLVLGLPFYGYAWNTDQVTAANWPYKNIVATYSGAENSDQTGNLIYYNGIPTIKSKTTYAIDNEYGGVMIWELSNDASGSLSLLNAINEVVNNKFPNELPTVSITNPLGADTIKSRTITLEAAAADNDGSVLRVEFFNGSSKLGEDLTAPYTFVWNNVFNDTYNITAKVTDNRGATTISAVKTIIVYIPLVRIPYNNTVTSIPGKIEVENYDQGGPNFTFSDLSIANEGGKYRTDAVDIETCNEGGFNLAYIKPKEWTEYSVSIVNNDNYKIEARVASTSGGTFHIEIDNVNISGTINVPNTGGWQNWQTVAIPDIALNAGSKIMRVVFDSGEFNVNYLNFALTSGLEDEKSFQELGIHIGPNPMTEYLNISCANSTTITILNLEGKMIQTVSSKTNSDIIHLDLTNLKSGIYILKANTKEGFAVEKIVKK